MRHLKPYRSAFTNSGKLKQENKRTPKRSVKKEKKLPFRLKEMDLMKVSHNQIAKAQGKDLSVIDLDAAYETFEDTYRKQGSVKSKSWFIDRAQNWVFYGNEEGYLTIRKQRSGGYKLTAIAGNQKTILQAFAKLVQEGHPIWGTVTQPIANMMVKVNFIQIPQNLMSILFNNTNPLIPHNTISAYLVTENGDGTLTIYDEELDQYHDKVIVVNKLWLQHTIRLGDAQGWPDGVINMLKALKDGMKVLDQGGKKAIASPPPKQITTTPGGGADGELPTEIELKMGPGGVYEGRRRN